MPFLEGQTLAARLGRGSVPLDQSVRIASEIADALDAAHRHGVVHRDLKPANIMLTKSGAKLLDFGLAKLKAPGGPISMSAMAQLATDAPGTARGIIMGTIQYMSPEQVEGKDADSRSDIWALGAVIYEMMTGARPFQGDSPASVIGSILKDEPPPMLDRIVSRCLMKDRDERWQSAADLRQALSWITSSSGPHPAVPAPLSSGVGRYVPLAAVVAGPNPEMMPSVSPDGRWIVYTMFDKGPHLMVRSFSGGAPREITPDGGGAARWLANGREIVSRTLTTYRSLRIQTTPDFSISKPEVIFPWSSNDSLWNPHPSDVTPDGSRFLLVRSEPTKAAPLGVSVVEHFFSELNRRAPVRK
jgi:serine/threonine protein kinase